MKAILAYFINVAKLFEVLQSQKWFSAAVLGFAFALLTKPSFSILQLQGVLIGVPLVLSYIMSINDYFDIDIDRLKEEYTGKEQVVSTKIPPRTALLLSSLALLAGLGSALLASTDFLLVVILMMFLGTIYSVPPLRLKMKYPYSTLLLFLGDFLPFLAGFALLQPLNLKAFATSSPFSLLAMDHRFEHEIDNYSIDKRTGKMTVAVKKGVKTARFLRRMCVIAGLGGFLLLFLLGWFSLPFVCLFALYFFLCVKWAIWFWRLPKLLQGFLSPLLVFSNLLILVIALLAFGQSFRSPVA